MRRITRSMPGRSELFGSAIIAVALGACSADGERDNAPITMSDLGLEGESYDDAVPEEFQSVIARAEPSAPRRVDGTQDDATAEIDATGERVMFPMHRGVRSFASHADLVAFVVDEFGAVEKIYDEETGELVGARGSYVQYGSSFFEDERIDTRFRVAEPVLARIGGVTGIVEVAGEEQCFDIDGDCTSERASYLDPVGEVTAATHVGVCSSGVCVQGHSFFNKTWFPTPWARHGTNMRFTNVSALPTSRLFVDGVIHVPPGWGHPTSWTTFALPAISNQGQDSIETAVWCFGITDCKEYQATAVCGRGTVRDPDVNATVRTGNGPDNNLRCPA